jgi:hypothetical protein
MNILNYLFYFLAGILLNMSLVHLVNFSETRHHPIIGRSRAPRMASTLWGLGYLFFGVLILLWLHYQFALSLDSVFIFLGFSAWAIFLANLAEKRDKQAKEENLILND